MQQSLLKFQNK